MDRKRRIGRETLGAGILLVLLLGGMLSSWEMGRVHDSISRRLEDAAWFALAGDRESARKAVLDAQSQWDSHRKITALLADHTPMEQIDALFARVHILYSAREDGAFAASCAELSRYVQAMGDAQGFGWENLL